MELPSEILEIIFSFLTKESQCISQYVCHAWHTPAKRIFYHSIHLTFDSKDDTQPDLFKRLIHSLESPISFHVSAGQCLRHLRVDFQIAPEPSFMPTVTDFQCLASYCPNLKSFLFPGKMFWRTIMETAHRFNSLEVLPALDGTSESCAQLAQFRHSLTSLEVASWQNRLPEIADYIAMFTKIQTLTITCRRFTNLHDVIPSLIRCPTVRHLILELTYPIRTRPIRQIVPRLTHLTLTLSKICPVTLSFIYRGLPALHWLSCKFTSDIATVTWSDEQIHVMQKLLSFSTTLHYANIHVFTGVSDLTHDLVRLFTKESFSLSISYDSRASTTSLIPDLVIEKKNDARHLHITYQGLFSHFPHDHFLTHWSSHLSYLQITYPGATRNQRKSDIDLILAHSPRLKGLVLDQAYIKPECKCSHTSLKSFTLKRCLLAVDSFSSFFFPSLQTLGFDQCEYVEERENSVLLETPRYLLQTFHSV
ncbi:hypothetical protein K501DRAFT_330160 [Backusella circina FSU 941]|nr:hypothetical protein K501DRAFT_330160 [Backusella circina FSU 941]